MENQMDDIEFDLLVVHVLERDARLQIDQNLGFKV